MCNQMVTSEIREGEAKKKIKKRKTQVKLFPYFTSLTFDYLLISWMTNYATTVGF